MEAYILKRQCFNVVFASAFSNLADCPAPALLLMRKLRTLPPKTLWPLANSFISRFRSILDDGVPRQVQGQQNTHQKLP